MGMVFFDPSIRTTAMAVGITQDSAPRAETSGSTGVSVGLHESKKVNCLLSNAPGGSRVIFCVLTMTFLCLTFLGREAWAGIVGSPHDFLNSTTIYTHHEGQICRICHVPHNAGTTEVPLWRRSLTTTGTYAVYASPTLNASSNQPMSPSKACLSCHDGTLDSATMPTSCSACHTAHGRKPNLTLHHPVSFVYNATLAQEDGALHDPGTTTVSSLAGKTIREGMLYQDRVECISCHDVHANKGDSGSVSKLLLVDNNRSRLCLTCHDK